MYADIIWYVSVLTQDSPTLLCAPVETFADVYLFPFFLQITAILNP